MRHYILSRRGKLAFEHWVWPTPLSSHIQPAFCCQHKLIHSSLIFSTKRHSENRPERHKRAQNCFYIISLKWRKQLDSKRKLSRLPVIHFIQEKREGSKNLRQLVCIQSSSIYSAQHSQGPSWIIHDQTCWGMSKNSIHQHFRKLQRPRVQKIKKKEKGKQHMKENRDRKIKYSTASNRFSTPFAYNSS